MKWILAVQTKGEPDEAGRLGSDGMARIYLWTFKELVFRPAKSQSTASFTRELLRGAKL